MITDHKIKLSQGTQIEGRAKRSGRMLLIKIPFYNAAEAQAWLLEREELGELEKLQAKENGDLRRAIQEQNYGRR